jgi:hypothetical protein
MGCQERKVETGRGEPPAAKEFFEPEFFYTPGYVIAHTRIPADPRQIPRIVGFAGTTRSGTTAFGLFAAGIPEVDRSYFQSHKNSLRWGGDIILNSEDRLVVMKETFGPLYPQETFFDPPGMLLAAGVPPEKQTWIFVLRDPVSAFASLRNFTDRVTPDFFAQSQQHVIDLYSRYRNSEVGVVPFVYDLFAEGEEKVMGRLLDRVGIDYPGNLAFDPRAVDKKMVWGEAEDDVYYEEVIVPTLSRGAFGYASGTVSRIELEPELEQVVRDQCLCAYETYRDLARRALDF